MVALVARCQVVNGPKYQLTLHGAGYKPRLHLSFMSFDFGLVHVWRPGMATSVALLHARNDDTQPVSFEVLWGDKEHLAVSAALVCVAPPPHKTAVQSR